ncbi:MAG: hypothetical protein J5449_03000 [Oscillospiraceae bacterium]|nr:hypothetical protein [Oscillospiraceae bacterium]
MNVGQLARQQQMMYKFIERGTGSYQSQMKAQLSSSGGYALSGQNDDSVANMLQSMGISGMQGRTVREMAQYQMRVQNTAETSAAQQSSGVDTTRFSVREQYTPISDEATAAMQKLALEDAKGSVTGEAADKTERAKLIQQHLKGVDPSRRAAAFNTMNKVWENETERIGNFIKEKDAGWNDWGDKFDAKLLDDYKPGINLWV